MTAREIAHIVAEALRNDREMYMELLEDEDYREIEDEICSWLVAE